MSHEEEKELMKQAWKEAFKETLADMVRDFGWFSLKFGAFVLGMFILYLALEQAGWKAPHPH